MNIFEKLMTARAELKKRDMKKSGKNQHTGIKYFDLSDILPHTTELEATLKMLSVVRFGAESATLTIYDVENPAEYIEFASPMSTAELKGCHAVQNLGAVETYIRRYLYIIAYEIVESETLDKTMGASEKKQQKTPREMLIDKLKEKGIDIKAYANEKGLNENTKPARYKELLKELDGKKE